MTRPHIDFLQDDALPVEQAGYDYLGPGVKTRVLSRDAASGAASLILDYPPGFLTQRPFALSATQELFVISGELEINGTSGRAHAYAHLPAGFERVSMRSDGGAKVLAFFRKHPKRPRRACRAMLQLNPSLIR